MTELACPESTKRADYRAAARLVECASLRRLDFFRPLSPTDMERVAQAAQFQRIRRRDPIAVPGTGCNYVSVLVEGLAKVANFDPNGIETIMYLIKTGEMFGGSVGAVHENAALIALQPCVTASIRVSDLESIIGLSEVSAEIDRIRTLRLRQMENRLAEVCMGRVPARVARTVLRLCREFPAALPCGTKVDVLFTQQDIASLIGATREATSSTINEFRRRGWLGVHNRYMCVHDTEGLQGTIAM